MYKCIYFYIHNRMIASYKVKKKKKRLLFIFYRVILVC